MVMGNNTSKTFSDESEILARKKLREMKKRFFGNTQFKIDWDSLNLN